MQLDNLDKSNINLDHVLKSTIINSVELDYDNLPRIGTTGSRNQNRDDYSEFTVTKHGYSWFYPRSHLTQPSQCDNGHDCTLFSFERKLT